MSLNNFGQNYQNFGSLGRPLVYTTNNGAMTCYSLNKHDILKTIAILFVPGGEAGLGYAG